MPSRSASIDPTTFLGEIREAVDERLARFFEEERRRVRAMSMESMEMVMVIEDLTMRGGKRLRSAMLASGFLCIEPEAGHERYVDACAALELLQSYLLIHDDWMDGDGERRGGASVHTAMRTVHRDPHLGDSLAVLAGSMANLQAWFLMLGSSLPRGQMKEFLSAYVKVQREVIFGQYMDLTGTGEVSRMYRLKTGSYTVRGPLILGALMAGASENQILALRAYADPLGEAFQLRDDLLGTFGDAEVTGKGTTSDLRSGKRTALILEAEVCLHSTDLERLRSILSRDEASEEELLSARALLDGKVRQNVEARLMGLLEEALAAISDTPSKSTPGPDASLSRTGLTLLGFFAERLALRSR